MEFLNSINKLMITMANFNNNNVNREKRARIIAGCHNNNAKVAFRGSTIWLSGPSSPSVKTLACAVEDFLLDHNIAVYLLDEESLQNDIKRAAETAKSLADSGQICLVPIAASSTEEDLDFARQIHEKAALQFYEVFVNTTGKRTVSAQEVTIPFAEGGVIYDCVQRIVHLLVEGETLPPSMMDTVPELFVPDDKLEAVLQEAAGLPALEIRESNLQWMQVLAEGWAAPLRGYMTEKQYLECLHFGTITDEKWGTVHNMTMPITLSLSSEEKERIEMRLRLGKPSIALSYTPPNTTTIKFVAILRNAEFYEHRKEERCCRVFGTSNPGHHGVQTIWNAGEWLVGGELEVLGRIKWNDDLDHYRLTPNELRKKFRELGADAVFVNQSRHPLHNGHALLFADTHKKLGERGYKKSFLFIQVLSSCSTKVDDIALSVRMRQIEALLEANIDGLKREQTVASIFPAPLMYGGPREVQWLCRTKMLPRATFFIVRRNAAGIAHPTSKGQSMYDPEHGSRVLAMAPGLGKMEILPLRIAVYDHQEKKMVLYDDNSHGDFDAIDGAKIKALIHSGTEPPPGYMDHKAWRVLAVHSK